MATQLILKDARLSFVLDFGQGASGQRKSKTVSLSGISPDADLSDVSAIMVKFEPILEPPITKYRFAVTSEATPEIV